MNVEGKVVSRMPLLARLLVGLVAMSAVALVAYYGLASIDRRQHPAPCAGLGGGCKPSASEATGIIAVIAIGPAALGAIVIGW